MGECRPWRTVLVLVALGAIAALVAPAHGQRDPATESPHVIELVGQADDLDPAVLERFEMRWQDDWRTTAEQTMVAWREVIEQAVADKDLRERHEWAGQVITSHALAARYPDDTSHRPDAEVQAARLMQRLMPDRALGVERLRAYRAAVDPDDAALRQRLRRSKLDLAKSLNEPMVWMDYVDDPEQAVTTMFEADASDTLAIELAARWTRLASDRGDFRRARRAVEMLERYAQDERDELRWRQLRGELQLGLGQLTLGQETLRPVIERMRERIEAGDDPPYQLAHLERALGTAMQRPQPSSHPNFASDGDIADAYARWEERGETPPAERLASMLASAAERTTLLRAGERTMASAWLALDRLARSAAPDDVAAAAQPDAERGAGDATIESWMARYRRRPSDPAGVEALAAAGEIALRRGWHGLAGRSLREAIERGGDASLREQLDALHAPGEATPGAAKSAAALRALSMPGSVRPALWRRAWLAKHDAYDVHRLNFAVQLLAAEEGYLIATPYLLARLDAAGDVRWAQSAPQAPPASAGHQRASREVSRLTAPAPVRPWIADGVAIARWGVDAAGELLSDVAAVDLATGAMHWHTATRPEWDDLWPVSDPVVSDGRVYVTVLRHGGDSVAVAAPVALACLDAKTGETRWVRTIASDAPLMPGRDTNHDLLHYGNRVTVADGAAYVVTGMGMVARVDARDGLVEWVHHYPRPAVESNEHVMLPRAGSAPVLVDAALVCVTRDELGAFALDAGTGELLWRDRTLPADRIAAVHAGRVVLQYRGGLVAVDAGSGEARWRTDFAEPITLPSVRHGEVLGVVSGPRLHEINMADGARHDEHALAHGQPVEAAASDGDGFVVLYDDATRFEAAVRSSASSMHHASLPRSHVTLWQPAHADDKAPAVFAFSDGLLECIDTAAEPTLRWQRRVEPGVVSQHRLGNALVLLYPQRAEAIALADGRTLWEARFAQVAHNWRWADGRLLIADRVSQWRTDEIRWLAAIDLADGEMLWRREPLPHWRVLAHAPIGWEGGSYYLVHPPDGKPFEPGAEVWTVAAERGTIVGKEPLYPDAWRGDDPSRRPARLVAVDGAALFAVGEDRHVFRIDLGRPGAVSDLGRLPDDFDFGRNDDTQLHLHERWVEVRRRYGGRDAREESTFFHRDAEHEAFQPEHVGTLRGDRLHARDGSTLRILDLSTQAERAVFELPDVDEATDGRIVHVHADDERITIFSVYAQDEGDGQVYLDQLRADSGEHVRRTRLPGLTPDALANVTLAEAIRGEGDAWVIAAADAVHLVRLPAAPGS